MHGFPVSCNLNRIIMIEAQKHGSTRGYVNQLFLMNFSFYRSILAADPMGRPWWPTSSTWRTSLSTPLQAGCISHWNKVTWSSNFVIDFKNVTFLHLIWSLRAKIMINYWFINAFAQVGNTKGYHFNTISQEKESMYLSVLKMRAISGTRGSSGLGSHSREHTESKTLLIVRAGDHWDLRMSRQIDPLELMLGW